MGTTEIDDGISMHVEVLDCFDSGRSRLLPDGLYEELTKDELESLIYYVNHEM